MSSPVTTISDIGKHEGQSVTIRGWLYNLRESGKLLFPHFRDGSGVIQGVVAEERGACRSFRRSQGPDAGVEHHRRRQSSRRQARARRLRTRCRERRGHFSGCRRTIPFPISLKEHGVDFLMEHRHLWIRTPRQAAILRVRAEIIKAARDFFDERGFTLTDPPILTPAACEGTTTLFPGRLLR